MARNDDGPVAIQPSCGVCEVPFTDPAQYKPSDLDDRTLVCVDTDACRDHYRTRVAELEGLHPRAIHNLARAFGNPVRGPREGNSGP